jgi:hypothetical protein
VIAMSETIMKRARVIYQTVCDIFNYDQSGDCVTSLDLARKQVETLPKGGTFCVPGAGIGTYIYALIEHGVKPQNIWAVESNSKYAELGALMFTRLGVNYIEADYLSWVPGVKFDAIVGNPPYGKNASLAVKFVNKSAELSDSIHYVLPRTFRKPSILNRIDSHLHLVEDELVGDEMFGGTILTCAQKWERRDECRGRIPTVTTHPDFKFVTVDKANLFVGGVGAAAGSVKESGFDHYNTRHYFLQVTDTVRERLVAIQGTLRELARAATVGTPSLSKHELISTYVERFG